VDAALALPVSVAARPRAFVRVSGPQSGDYLQRMVSNDVLALPAGGSCDALLLTPKARVIATLRVLRRDDDDFLLLTEPELGETVRDHLQRMRFAARCEISLEARRSHLVLGASEPPGGVLSVPNEDYGVPGWEILDAGEPPDASTLGDEELERLRIEAGTPRFGREIDDRILPAEAGLDRRAISFDKGCYPGQEPVARLRYRGHANRSLRIFEIAAGDPPPYDAEIEHDGKVVGRLTSAVAARGGVVGLGYVRTEVPDSAVVSISGSPATMTRPRP
jgi:folate-binding protein YgfZ